MGWARGRCAYWHSACHRGRRRRCPPPFTSMTRGASAYLLFTYFRLMPFQALYTFPQSIDMLVGRPSSSYYFVGSQVDNLFYLDLHHARTTIQLRLPPHAAEHEHGIPIKQVAPERGSASPLGHNRSPTLPASSLTGPSTFSHHSPALHHRSFRNSYRSAAHQ